MKKYLSRFVVLVVIVAVLILLVNDTIAIHTIHQSEITATSISQLEGAKIIAEQELSDSYCVIVSNGTKVMNLNYRKSLITKSYQLFEKTDITKYLEDGSYIALLKAPVNNWIISTDISEDLLQCDLNLVKGQSSIIPRVLWLVVLLLVSTIGLLLKRKKE